MQIKVVCVGRIRESWLNEAIHHYVRRLSAWGQIAFQEVKDSIGLERMLLRENNAVALDPDGTLHKSEDFSNFLFHQLERGGARVAFVIGGPEGLPQVVRRKLPLISLSPLTFPAHIARLLLVEQIYRAVEIRKGSPYHK